MRILLAMALILGGAQAAWADLCDKCKGGAYTADIGVCKDCKGQTPSGAFQLCPACSKKLQQCEHCRAALQPVISIGEDSDGKTVDVAGGSKIVVTLAGNQTTGFSWVVAKLEGDAIEKDGEIEYKGKGGGLGSGGSFVASFRAAKPGKSTLTMEYRRPWEKEKAPAKTFTLTLVVKKEPDSKVQEWSGACRGERSRIESKELVRVTNAEEWTKLWRRHVGDPKADAPQVDFEKFMVVAVFFGKCGWAKSGHETGVRFESLKAGEKEDALKIAVELTFARYACQDAFPFWIGVLPKRTAPLHVTAVLTSPQGGQVDVGEIQ